MGSSLVESLSLVVLAQVEKAEQDKQSAIIRAEGEVLHCGHMAVLPCACETSTANAASGASSSDLYHA
jgi:hypothetical protein